MELFQVTKTFERLYETQGIEAARQYFEQIISELSKNESYLVETHFKSDLDYQGMLSRLRYIEIYLGYAFGMKKVIQ